jgi:predicted DNA-binding ribbon-helix-helix protein
MSSLLVSRNIVVNGRRTSIRLERAAWDALDDICYMENVSLNQLCSLIESRRSRGSRTSAVRAYIVSYYHQLALGARQGKAPPPGAERAAVNE